MDQPYPGDDDVRDFVDIHSGSNLRMSGGLYFTEVDGLGPAKATIAHSEFAMVPGAVYHSSNVGARNIVIKAGFNPDYATGRSVQDLRRELYRTIPPETDTRVRLYDDESYAMRVDGYIESIEPIMFSKDPEVQISIICPRPWLRSPSETVVENLTPEIRTIQYDGELQWGLTLDVTPTRDLTWIEVQDMDHPIDGRPTLRINYPFRSNHRLRLVTSPGWKEASLRDSNGVFLEQLRGAIDTYGNPWPMIKPGTNRIRVRGSMNDGLRWDITLINRFAGF